MIDDCLFCKINRGEIPALSLYEDEFINVIMDAYPNTDGHMLIIPKKHYEDILNLPDDCLLHIFHKAQEIMPEAMRKLNKNALTLLFNYGDSQVIKHVHLHLLPDYLNSKNEMSKEEAYKILKED